jgi:hypothetical protein
LEGLRAKEQINGRLGVQLEWGNKVCIDLHGSLGFDPQINHEKG